MNQPERVLFVHAHPDDETISTGGTLATLVESGAVVTVVTCTRGERGEVIPADLKANLDSHALMASMRESELEKAVRVLGVTDHRWLGEANARWNGKNPRVYVDSGMQWGSSGAEATTEYDPSSLTSAEFGDVAADIAAVILDVQPHAVVSYDEKGGYGHPDHVRAQQAARRAAEVYGVPFFAIETAESLAQATTTVDLTESSFAKKRGALLAYRSQVSVTGDDFALSNGSVQPIGRAEGFRRVATEGDEPYRFAQQSTSAKIAVSVIAALVGVAAGAIGSVYCTSTLAIGTAHVWLGVIIGIVVLLAVLVGFRLAFATRLVALWAAVGAIVIVALFSLQSAGGTVLVPLTPVGITWAISPVVVAALVLAWPQVLRRSPGKLTRQPSDLKGR